MRVGFCGVLEESESFWGRRQDRDVIAAILEQEERETVKIEDLDDELNYLFADTASGN